MTQHESQPGSPNSALLESLLGHLISTTSSIQRALGSLEAQTLGNRDAMLQRTGDLMIHIDTRMERIERRIDTIEAGPRAQTEHGRFTVQSLFGSVGSHLLELLPWRHILYMVPGIILAIAGHMMPDRAAAILKLLMPAP